VSGAAPVAPEPAASPAGQVAVLGDGPLAGSLRAALGVSHDLPPPEPRPAGGTQPGSAPAWVVVVAETAFLPTGLERANHWLRGHRTTGLPVHASWDATTIGPVLLPDQPGCYRCLQTRRRAARAGGPTADRELWQRFATGRLAAPPPVLTAPLLATVAALVADECDRLHTGQPPRTRHAVLRVHPSALTVDRHRFLPDPACEVCGGVPGDAAELALVALQPRPKADPDSCRTGATPRHRELVERFVDPLAGLIHSVQVDYSGTTVNATAAIHIGADEGGPARDFAATGSGRSLDRDSSVTVAILEALERYAGLTADLGKRTVVRASYRELPEPEAVDPRTLGLPRPELLPTSDGYVEYHPDLPMPWVWGWSFRRARPVLVPETIGYYYRRQGPQIAYECSSGCALGSCLEEAILHGIFEVAERDGFLLTWYARLPVPQIDWRTVPDPVTRLLAARLEATTGDRLHLLNTTMPEGVPSIAAMVVDESDRPGYAKAFFGGGAHLSPDLAIRSAVREVALSDGRSPLPAAEAERARAMLADPDLVTELEHHGWVYYLPESWPRLAFLRHGPVVSLAEAFPPGHRPALSQDLAEDLRYAVERYLRGGLDVVVVDQTIPEHRAAGLACTKVVIPGTLPMTFGHRHRRAAGIPRLHTTPVLLGYRSEPLPVGEINPHPHPFP
jgi:ribosomal protein S12 methylthiotransferase accessory factor